MNKLKPLKLPNGAVLGVDDISPKTVVAVVWKEIAAGIEHQALMDAVETAEAINIVEAKKKFEHEKKLFEVYSKRTGNIGESDRKEFADCIIACCVWNFVINGEQFRLAGIEEPTNQN